LRAIGSPDAVVTGQMLSAIYRTEVLVEQTPSGRRVCVPAWETAAPAGQQPPGRA
jgi:ABC-type cobalamin/Fe3+-siderophores transport system ATPase subunit